MTELPDDELDKLFRKSSEELDPQFDPEDWANMKKRLDQHDGKTPAAWLRKWWPLGMLALLLPIGIIGYQFTHRQIDGAVVRKNEAGLKEREKGEEKKEGPEGGREVVRVEGGVKTIPGGVAGELGSVEGERVVISNEVEKLSKAEKVSPRSLAGTGGVYLAPRRLKVEDGDGAFSSSEAVIDAAKPAGTTKGENAETNTFNISVNPLHSLGGRWETAMAMPQIPPVPAVEVQTDNEAQKAERSDFSRWAVRFGYSPDLSTVGLKDFSKPGTAVSLLAEYAILKRLYIQSGAIWSRKEYYGSGSSYQLPTIPHYYPPEITGVEGMCKVLEVPVNLRFDLLDRKRSTVLIGAGVSSYHMNKEKYDYSFENENDPKIKYRSWEGKTGWYWLSHLNASAGYEYRLSNKLSLLAEPYLRAPLKRVGYGKVNLFTTGMWISVRFKPSF